MLRSVSKNLVFIHVQKTAGWSIREDLVAQVPDLETIGHSNDSARDAFRLLGRDVWNGAFTFAFVRNPWDRLLSWWSMIDNQRPRAKLFGLKKAREPRFMLWRYAIENARTFEEFVTRCTAEVIPDPVYGDKSFVRPQCDYLSDESGELCVDFVGRFESLLEDYGEVRERLGLSPVEMPHIRHKSRHDHYSRYYDDRTRRIVEERFAVDIERFGYRFEDRRVVAAAN